MTASNDIGAAAEGNASPEAKPASDAQPSAAAAPRSDTARDTLALIAAAVVGAAGGYFGHPSAPLPPSFANFDKESTPREILKTGWSGFEQMAEGDTFVWCMEKSCTLSLGASAEGHMVRVRAFAFTYPNAPEQTVTLFVNGKSAGRQVLWPRPTVVQFETQASAWKNGRNDLRFDFAYADSPLARSPGAKDRRTLSAAFDWVDIVPVVK